MKFGIDFASEHDKTVTAIVDLSGKVTAMAHIYEVMEMGAHVALTREGDVLISPPDGIDLHAAAHVVMEQAQ